MKFNSKPHSIQAFKFEGKGTYYPSWFTNAINLGHAYITINNKNQYISIQIKRGTQKAFLNEYICLNTSGTIFVLSEQEILDGFTLDGGF